MQKAIALGIHPPTRSRSGHVLSALNLAVLKHEYNITDLGQRHQMEAMVIRLVYDIEVMNAA